MAAAQLVVDMVDLVEDGAAGERSLVERLCEASQKTAGYLSETSKQYMAHILGLVKSYWPGANLTPLGDGLAAGCSDEQFAQYVEEVKSIADKVIDNLEQASEGEVYTCFVHCDTFVTVIHHCLCKVLCFDACIHFMSLLCSVRLFLLSFSVEAVSLLRM